MITVDYVKTMAAYTRWQNGSLYSAAETLTDRARRQDRGAFFKSIHGTLNHLLWGDELWLSRFCDTTLPTSLNISESQEMHSDWDELSAARSTFDQTLQAWADGVTPVDLDGSLSWYSGAMGKEVTKPKALLVSHMFNHGTHHRGQVHAMLTAAGARPDDTDLPFMPEYKISE